MRKISINYIFLSSEAHEVIEGKTAPVLVKVMVWSHGTEKDIQEVSKTFLNPLE